MGEPLSPDRVFDFPVDEPEPHPTYDFFAPGLLLGYAGNPNNNNGWLEADDYLLGELEAMVDEPMVIPAIKEVAEPVAEAEEEQDLAVLFGDDDFEDDASDGFDEEEVWEVNEEWLMSPTTPPLVLAVPPPSVYEAVGPSTAAADGPSFPHSASGLPVPPSVIEDLSTRLGYLEYGHGQLVQMVIQVIASQMVHAVDRWEQVGAQVEQGGWKLRRIIPRLEMRNGEDFSYVRCALPLTYQLMAVKKTSFPELESSVALTPRHTDFCADEKAKRLEIPVEWMLGRQCDGVRAGDVKGTIASGGGGDIRKKGALFGVLMVVSKRLVALDFGSDGVLAVPH
ncbi:hypothetical protein Tco_1106875 [Tanacetum coccineum]